MRRVFACDDVYLFYHICQLSTNPALIIWGGRVGHTIANRFKEREMPYLIIEKNPRCPNTHDDDANIYLTKYLRSLRPDMQILSRANLERNVSTLHRAGADFVMCYSSLGANAIFNFLKNEGALMLAEGLNVFHLKAPQALVGKNLAQSKIRQRTGCSVVAVKVNGVMAINPDPQAPIQEDAELILIGTYEGENKLLQWSEE